MSRALLSFLAVILLFHSSFGAAENEVTAPQPPPVSQSSKWVKKPITIHLSTSLRRLDRSGDGSAVLTAVVSALKSWESASGIKFLVRWTDSEGASPSQSRGDRKNIITVAPVPENLLMFSGDSYQEVARTRVFADRRGAIYEADIVLNPYQQFSVDGAFGSFDLQSVITHEIGHLLGMPHSPVIGATMFDRLAKNGTFGAVADSARTLSLDDVTALRSLYGKSDEGCCGSVSAQVDGLASGVRLVAWIEEESTGRVASGRYVDDSGAVRFDGVEPGRYILRFDVSQSGPSSRSPEVPSGFMVDVAVDDDVSFRVSVRNVRRSFGAPFGGTDGEFSAAPFVATPGRTGRMVIGSPGAFTGGAKIFSTSPLLAALETQIYGGQNVSGLSLLGFDFSVKADAPEGEYTIGVIDASGTRRFLIGGITVENGAPEGASIY